MIPATWKKVFADLQANKARSILAALSIAVGAFAVGIITASMIVVRDDLLADYASVNPHTARIYTQDFDATLVKKLRRLPEVESVDASYNLWVKIGSAGGKFFRINLNTIASLDEIVVDRLSLESGSPVLADGEIYLDRQGAEGLGWKPGDTVIIERNDGSMVELKLAGAVHDVQGNPFNFNSVTSGFVTAETMEKLGGSQRYNFVNLVTVGSHTDADHVRTLADRVADEITDSGTVVANVHVQRPGQPSSQATLDTVMALMGALSVLGVLLSTFLVTNTVSALMGQQIRQIGVMKALGATFFQVTAVYLGLVLSFGALALLAAVPLGALASYGLSRWLIGMLNANATQFYYPLPAVLVQLFIGLAVPVAAALVPVTGGARRTIRQAITNYGLEASAKAGLLDRVVEALTWLPRPLLLSLRNTFRRKARLALTLATLTLGGAIFIAILGVRDSMTAELIKSLSYIETDVNADFSMEYPALKLKALVEDIPGVAAVETWSSFDAHILRPDSDIADLVDLFVPPDGSAVLQPVMIAGRWLAPGESGAIVLSNHFMKIRPDVRLGDTVTLRLAEKDRDMQVVGFFRISGNYPAPFIYITPAGLAAAGGNPNHANRLKVVTDVHTPAGQEEVLEAVEARLKSQGLDATLQTGSEFLLQQLAVISILINLLVAMGVLIAVVGGLGLMGTMGMNVLERTREIGVLRSIGAQNGAVFQLVVVEGALIGMISWALSALVAVPITSFLDQSLGSALMTIPLVFIYSTEGLLIWLVVVLALSALASLVPAWSAVRLTVRDVLAYE